MGKNKILLSVQYGMVLILFFIVGCVTPPHGKLAKSAGQYYIAGNYDKAVFDCVAALKMKPTYRKAQILIQDAFRNAVGNHKSEIEKLKPSSAKFKWDNIVSEYEAWDKLNKAVKSLPTLMDKKTKAVIRFKIVDLSQAIGPAKTNAADVHYKEGIRLAKKEGIDIQKRAAKEFKAAMRYQPGYKDAASRYEQCRRAGVKRIAIIPFKDKSGKKGRYGAISETVTDEIISNVINDPSAMEFLDIISRDQLEQVMQEQKLGLRGIIDDKTAAEIGKILGIHEMLTGKITQIIYTPERTVKKSIREEKSVAIGEKKVPYTDKKGRRKYKTKTIWGDVYANVTYYTKTAKAKIVGSYKIIGVKTARIKKTESFTEESSYKYEWARFTGDERALSRNAESLASRDEEFAPPEEEMVTSAAHKLSNSLAETLKKYAR